MRLHRIGVLLLVSVMLVYGVTGEMCSCPEKQAQCVCFCKDSDVTIVECIDTHMDPSTSNDTLHHLPQTVSHLFFNGNHLPEIGDNMFGTSGHFDDMLFLSLMNNSIQSISGRAFHRIASLDELYLDDNHWHLHGNHKVFSNLRFLRVLSLSNAFAENHNITRQLMHLSRVFSESSMTELMNLSLANNNIPLINLDLHLPKLTHLNLADNNMVSISFNATDLAGLRTLNLSNNAFPTFDNATIKGFGALANLTEVDLRANKFVCDCELKPVYAWLKSSPRYLKNVDKLKCWKADQEKFKGKAIITLESKDLTCTPLPQPVESSVIVLSVLLVIIALLFIVVMYMNREKLRYRTSRVMKSLRESWSMQDGYSSVTT